MPTYAYRCAKCDHEFEVFAKISGRPRARKCPACGGRAIQQISGGAGFLFKGEGFYTTDYRSEEYRSKAAAEGGPPAAAEDGAPGKTPPGEKPTGEKTPGEKTPGEGKEPAVGDGRKRGKRSRGKSGSDGKAAGAGE